MKEWERIFRTGDMATDWRQAEAWRHEAWQRGVALQSDPLPDGGYRVYAAQTQPMQRAAMQYAAQPIAIQQMGGAYPNPMALVDNGCHLCRRAVPTKHASITRWRCG